MRLEWKDVDVSVKSFISKAIMEFTANDEESDDAGMMNGNEGQYFEEIPALFMGYSHCCLNECFPFLFYHYGFLCAAFCSSFVMLFVFW
jgi:predicted choloylglycine hydrolase